MLLIYVREIIFLSPALIPVLFHSGSIQLKISNMHYITHLPERCFLSLMFRALSRIFAETQELFRFLCFQSGHMLRTFLCGGGNSFTYRGQLCSRKLFWGAIFHPLWGRFIRIPVWKQTNSHIRFRIMTAWRAEKPFLSLLRPCAQGQPCTYRSTFGWVSQQSVEIEEQLLQFISWIMSGFPVAFKS